MTNRINAQHQEETSLNNEKKETDGYMALRNNVFDLKLELWHLLKPLEYFILDLIINKTIKWRQTEAKITIAELKEQTRQDHSRIYRALKALEKEGVISRRKQGHDLIIGLNEAYFGELLIKKHADALEERKSKIKMVVDNSEKVCGISTGFVQNMHMSRAKETQGMCRISTEKVTEEIEIIEENPVLKTFFKDTNIKTLLKESEPSESFTLGKKGSLEPRIMSAETRDKQRRWVLETNGEIDFNVWEKAN